MIKGLSHPRQTLALHGICPRHTARTHAQAEVAAAYSALLIQILLPICESYDEERGEKKILLLHKSHGNQKIRCRIIVYNLRNTGNNIMHTRAPRCSNKTPKSGPA